MANTVIDDRRNDEFSRYKKKASAARTVTTPDGRKWAGRMRAAENFFRANAKTWDENIELTTGFEKVLKKWGSVVAIGYAVLQNFVSDLWFQNPDPMIQDKRGNVDAGRIMSDVLRAVHADAGTERNMRAALEDTGWAGYGVIQQWFDETGEWYYRPISDPNTGEPLLEEDGAPPIDPITGDLLVERDEDGMPVMDFEPTDQRIRQRRISPWDFRVDPDVTEWTLDDAKFVAFRFFMSLGAIDREKTRFTQSGRAMLRAFVSRNQDRFIKQAAVGGAAGLADYEEGDLDWIRIPIWEIWDRVSKTIVYRPAFDGSTDGAEFLLNNPDETPWPVEFAKFDRFPVEFVGFNRAPEDEKRTQGFWPIPLIDLVKHHIKAIQRLEALFLEANTHVINKYVIPEGFFDDAQIAKLTSDENRAVLTYDPNALTKLPGVQASVNSEFDIRRIFQLVPQNEIKEMRHIQAIEHELNLIAQIIGQTTADRGGLANSSSATEALGLQQRLKQRIDNLRARVGFNYNRLTEMMWHMLQARQELPLRYQATTGADERVWAEITADQFTELDLHFEHSTAPQEPRTREQEIALRRQAAEILMPVYQASGDTMRMDAVARMLVEPLQLYGIDNVFNNEINEIAMRLAEIEMGLMDGTLSPTGVAVEKQELLAKLLQLILPSGQLQQVASGASGRPEQEGAERAVGALSGAKSQGQSAYAAAAAGAVGGMSGGA
jgi:hypothetical protein